MTYRYQYIRNEKADTAFMVSAFCVLFPYKFLVNYHCDYDTWNFDDDFSQQRKHKIDYHP